MSFKYDDGNCNYGIIDNNNKFKNKFVLPLVVVGTLAFGSLVTHYFTSPESVVSEKIAVSKQLPVKEVKIKKNLPILFDDTSKSLVLEDRLNTNKGVVSASAPEKSQIVESFVLDDFSYNIFNDCTYKIDDDKLVGCGISGNNAYQQIGSLINKIFDSKVTGQDIFLIPNWSNDLQDMINDSYSLGLTTQDNKKILDEELANTKEIYCLNN